MNFPSGKAAVSWEMPAVWPRLSWEDGKSAESLRYRVAKPSPAVMSCDLSNTGSFSYRPDQIGNPYDFSLNTGSQGTDFGCTNPGHQTLDCWFNQAVFVTPSLAPGQQSSHSLATRALEIFAARTWLTLISCCKRTSRFASHSNWSFAPSSSTSSIIQTSVCRAAGRRSLSMYQAAPPSPTRPPTIVRSSSR